MRWAVRFGLLVSILINSDISLAEDATDLIFVPAKIGDMSRIIDGTTGNEIGVVKDSVIYQSANCPLDSN